MLGFQGEWSPLNLPGNNGNTIVTSRCARRTRPRSCEATESPTWSTTSAERDLGAVVGTAIWIEDPMLRHRRPIQPIGRRSEHVLQRPAAGQAPCLAGRGKKKEVAFGV